MVAGRSLKEIISRTKQAARNIRQTLDEIAQELGNQRQLQPQPALARVPVNRSKHPFGNKSFNRRGYGTFTRQQSVRYASTFIRPNYVVRNNVRQQLSKNLWCFNSFKALNNIGGNTISKGIFPSTLYSNFVKTNSRNYHSYTNFTQQVVRNLNQSIRAVCLQSKDELMQKRNFGCSNNLAYTQEVYKMAKTNSTFAEELEYMNNCFVDFNLNSVQYTVPTMTFMDDDVLNNLQIDLIQHGEHLQNVYKQVELIKNEFGSLPMSLEQNGSILRIHFTNCDSSKVELLLRDIGVTKGVIHEVYESCSSASSRSSPLSSHSSDDDRILSTIEDDHNYDLSSYYMSDDMNNNDISDIDDDSIIMTDEFFPVMDMEMSDPILIVDQLNTPIIV